MKCRHEKFRTEAQVTRGPGDPVHLAFSIELRAQCSDCGQVFEFGGLPPDLLGWRDVEDGRAPDPAVACLPIRPSENQINES